MPVQVSDRYLKNFLSEADYAEIAPELSKAARTLAARDGKGNDFLGWIDLPDGQNQEELSRIVKAGEKIRKQCDVLLVIGIGGSYLGARAAIEFIHGTKYNSLKKDTPDIWFVGNDLSASTIAETLALCEGREVCLNVISKSGTTTEPAVAFRIFRAYMEDRYGKEEAAKRTYVTTDRCRGKLKELSDREGYETFVVPDDVGGRFSVLSPVGLLPIVASGVSLEDLLAGAKAAKEHCFATEDLKENEALRYVAARNLLYRKGRAAEVFVSYEPSFAMTAEWWKQLYGESEGKEGKGIFPCSVTFTTDLHSLGQFIQEGSNILFETVINLKTPKHHLTVPFDPENADGLNFLAQKSLQEVNQSAFVATAMAHLDGNTPSIVLDLDSRSAYDFGYLVYFFEYACAVSGYVLDVNPFNQPGVEAYKKNMFALLGKPGEEHDRMREILRAKML